MDRTRTKSRRGGYILISLVLLVALVPVLLLAAERIATSMKHVNDMSLSTLTRSQVDLIKNRLSLATSDPDQDGSREPLAPSGADGIPLSLAVDSKDQWGTELRYCAWDLGNANTDVAYARFAISGAAPVADLTIRIVSAGRDKAFQTACADVVASGDDLVSDTFHGDIVASRGINSLLVADFVATTPVKEIEFTGLDSNSDGEYELTFEVVGGPPAGSAIALRLFVNGDTTLTNYTTEQAYDEGAVQSLFSVNTSTVGTVADGLTNTGHVRISCRGGKFVAYFDAARITAGGIVGRHKGTLVSIPAVNNITSLTIWTVNADSLAAGSRITLRRLY